MTKQLFTGFVSSDLCTFSKGRGKIFKVLINIKEVLLKILRHSHANLKI